MRVKRGVGVRSLSVRWTVASNFLKRLLANWVVLLASMTTQTRRSNTDSIALSSPRSAIFIFNLLQDVGVLRPLVFIARDLDLKTEFLVSAQFHRRDHSGVWRRELNEIAKKTDSSTAVFGTVFGARQQLDGKSGILIAGSESNLAAHSAAHDVFRIAPPSFLKVTLQHGFECVGFLHNRSHDVAHGQNITFAADVVCGWCEGDRLSSMEPSQRSKLYVSGPPLVLHPRRNSPSPAKAGIICENLHSVRLNVEGDFRTSFISIFSEFCSVLEKEGQDVILRPHPGGQYVVKNKVALGKNVRLNNKPIYEVDLSAYSYGISAPSSVLIDMMLAGIPVAVWRDQDGRMDADNYQGLAEVRSAEDWLNFAHEASSHPEKFLERQRAFIERQRMPVHPKEVRRRFEALLASVADRPASFIDKGNSADRILFISNGYIPTLEVNFILPLRKVVERGQLVTEYITENQMREKFGKNVRHDNVRGWLAGQLSQFQPNLMVFCRYSGPHVEYLREWARHHNVPVIYHIDDDLLHVPIEIVGQKKFDYHNDPLRLAAVRYLLDHSSLVYCSTARLAQRLETLGVASTPISGTISCSGRILVRARDELIKTIGYMGFDHAHDFKIVISSLVTLLRENPKIRFELFGAIPRPVELDEFGERIGVLPPVKGYEEFLAALSERKWQIGICPLADMPFNSWKSVNKWVEYTSVGAAVVATAGTIYDECCAGGCGVLAGTSREWLSSLSWLVHHPRERFAMVMKAQRKLEEEYSTDRLGKQVLSIFERAKTSNEKPCSTD